MNGPDQGERVDRWVGCPEGCVGRTRKVDGQWMGGRMWVVDGWADGMVGG